MSRIVVLGAGFGGLLTALSVAKKSKGRHKVVLVDRGSCHVFSPWLYEVCTGFLINSKKEQVNLLKKITALDIKKIIKMSGVQNLQFRISGVTGCNFETKHVIFESGKTLGFDKLVVALGSETAHFGIDGAEEFSVPLKTVDDSLLIREKLEHLLKKKDGCTILIAGAGATGVECAGELANFLNKSEAAGAIKKGRIKIILIDSTSSVLSRFSRFSQKKAGKRLKSLGVRVLLDSAITKVEKTKAKLKNTDIIDFDLLIWAGGVNPNSILKDLALPKDPRGRIKISSTMQVNGHPDVYAIGDTTLLIDEKSERPVPATAWATVGQAKILAANLVLKKASKRYALPKRFPEVIAVGGKYTISSFRGIGFSGFFAFLFRRLVELNYFIKIMPFFKAMRFWRQSVQILSKND